MGLMLAVAVVAVCGALANACPGLWVLMYGVGFVVGVLVGTLA